MHSLLSIPYGKILIALRFLRSHLKIVVAVSIFLVLVFVSYAVTRPKQVIFVTAVAERGELRQTVEAVGTVISEKDLSLQFPTVDVVSKVYVKEGDTVKAGQRLASLRSGSLAASVAGASANRQSAQAQLDALLEGSRPEDIAIAEAQVANKRASLEAVKQTLKNAEDNLKTAESQLTVLRSEAAISLAGQVGSAGSTIAQHLATAKTALLSSQGVFNANDVQDGVVKGIPSGYDAMQQNILASLSAISSLQASASVTDYQTALRNFDLARQILVTATNTLNRAYDILSALPITSYFTNTSRETNKSTIATQKSYVQSALSSIDVASKSLRDDSAVYDTRISSQQSEIVSLQGTRDRAKADINTYQTSLAIDQAQLDLKRAPARKTDIDAATARVRQAQADLARAAAQFSDTILTAPVAGIVTKVNVKAGEMRPSSEASVEMLGESPYRIEMFVSEVDIPKVKFAQTGSIKLDAFRSIEFALKVSEIDSAATDKDGVSKYRVKLDFLVSNDGLKVGMTGDGEITTGMRTDVVSVPLRSVLETETGSKLVRILRTDGKSFDARTVTTGMEGVGGNVEVTGVKEGDVVVVLIKQ
ncbi:efflux RND transporter periplasmic adaptor subunit [Candidatus Peribacteria bacterium]|nr:efflux RND transporter periplasmic adaptor subunit [Candidatus Peribacteria bacterium]